MLKGKRAFGAAALIATMTLLTSGCFADYSMFGANGARTHATGESGGGTMTAANVGTLHKLWNIAIPHLHSVVGGLEQSAPTAAGGYLYVNGVGPDFRLHKLDMSGNEIWNATTYTKETGNDPRATPPTVAGGVVYAAFQTQLFAFRDSDGSALWTADFPPGYGLQFDASGFQPETPVVAGNNVFIQVLNHVFEYSTATRARVDTGQFQVGTGGGDGAPAIVGNELVMSNGFGRVTAYNIATGTQMWTNTDNGTPVLGTAIVGTQVVVAHTGGLFSLGAATGTTQWQATNFGGSNVGAMTAPAVANGTVYIGAGNCGVKSFSLTNGSPVAATNDGCPESVSVENGVVFTTNPVRAYDATTLARLTDTGWSNGNLQAQNESVVSHGKLWQVNQFGELVAFGI